MPFIVELHTMHGISYLRQTTWTFQGRRERAQEFETRENAQDQLDKAKPFMKRSYYKSAQIREEV